MNQKNIGLARHSLAHLMAAAIQKLWPNVRFGVGPFIENGFYYDIEIPDYSLTEADLEKIEEKMREFIKTDIKYIREEISLDEAIEMFQDLNQPYKVELLRDIKTKGTTKIDAPEFKFLAEDPEVISIYYSGDFVDLCRGPHLESVRDINLAFKLTHLAGAYWRGDEKNKMLTRIYGLAFATQKELDEHLAMLEEAKKRDHRKLGKELDLFVFSDLVGPGMPLFTPKGYIIRKEIIKLDVELQENIGFLEVHTPQINKAELFKISGHWDKYKNDMLMVKSHYSDEEYFLKPMNCPQHTQIYASQKRSYRDLPIRYADFANLFRDEKPGELSGLTRLRCFAQDDGHSFCREDQIAEEFANILEIINKALKIYGLDYYVRLSLWDENQKEKYLGDEKIWTKSQALLEQLLKDNKINYQTALGEAAFYGPKMDIIAKDAIGREWQLSTIQLDFNMPERFNLKYTDSDGLEKHPVMVHRAIIGSPERFLGILLEHYAGAFPLWLSPVQVKILSVASTHEEHCQNLVKKFKQALIRAEADITNETLGNKIRKASGEKIPYLLVIGDKEINSDKLAVRVRGQEKLLAIGEAEFMDKMKKLIAERSPEL
ncbi:MAG: threonine--tRNA ligase [Candidatus Komeilibacteria bacterium]|nr:threonine--tRNA ligase [Candidatus Komeilibacteria bacterium]